MKLEELEDTLKRIYLRADCIASMMKIYVNVVDNDELTKKDLLTLLYDIDEKMQSFQKDLLCVVESLELNAKA